MTAEKQLDAFIAKYTPELGARAQDVLARMRQRLPGAIELVYDNYNALAIGFGPSEHLSDLIFSIALYPRWVSLFFTQGAALTDPEKLLRGDGKRIRHIVLEDASLLDSPSIRALMNQALEHAGKPLNKKRPNRIVVKSVSARQRPRRPAPSN